ncbi:Restriction-modification system protein [Corynebacterium endometrii]|uniref:Restriction-modification system protein n=1 Tax=Corynebacterium endometrii TaxID=2488819 RepID=A0A4P7QGG5_9CORY|nr:Restriction-modification system protein [Corynebacterium endometrii]
MVYTVLKPRTEYIDSRYAELLFKSKAFQDEYYRWGTGIVDDLWSTRYERFASIRLPLPPLETQRRIADYLDKETAQIDTLTAELDGYVELLEKRRRETISTAVSSLPNGSPFELVPLNLIIRVADGLVDPLDEEFSELPLIAPNHIEKNTGKLIEPIESAREQGAISGKGFVRAGQVVYSKIRPALNKVTIANQDSLCSADMYPLETMGNVHERFLLYALIDKRFVESAVVESSRVAMPKVNRETLGVLRIPLPDLDTQRRIADYLDKETARIDTLIKECRELKEILLKRRQVLITDVVTGKVEV